MCTCTASGTFPHRRGHKDAAQKLEDVILAWKFKIIVGWDGCILIGTQKISMDDLRQKSEYSTMQDTNEFSLK